MAGQTNPVNTTLYDKLNFTFHRGIAPVAGVMSAPSVSIKLIESDQDAS
jgi:hypothetical protein